GPPPAAVDSGAGSAPVRAGRSSTGLPRLRRSLIVLAAPRAASGTQLGPLLVGPAEQIFRARAAQVHAAVDRDHLAVDVARSIRDEVTGQVGQLVVLAGPTQGVALDIGVAAPVG